VQRVRAEAARYVATPVLITVDPGGTPHCSLVVIQWSGDQLIVPAPQRWSEYPCATQEKPNPVRSVSVLYPPASPGGYALVIDGTAASVGRTLTVSLTGAVLHRRHGATDTFSAAGCGEDCIQLLRPADR